MVSSLKIPEFQNSYENRQQLIYEDFLEQARAMINLEYAKARETITCQANDKKMPVLIEKFYNY
jgi:hypothetical protein